VLHQEGEGLRRELPGGRPVSAWGSASGPRERLQPLLDLRTLRSGVDQVATQVPVPVVAHLVTVPDDPSNGVRVPLRGDAGHVEGRPDPMPAQQLEDSG
jgi:hypothetical protein